MSLKWTYAYSDGRPTHIAQATKGESYSLDREGQVPMVLKWGQINSKHFSLASNASLGETELHRYCKNLCADLLRQGEHLKGNVRFWLQCPCGTWHCINSFPEHNRVEVEARLKNGLIPDVLLTLDDAARFGFEVRHRHAVDQDKKERYGMPWLEFDATNFLQSSTSLPHNVYALDACHSLLRCQRCVAAQRMILGLKKFATPVVVVGGVFLVAAVISSLLPPNED